MSVVMVAVSGRSIVELRPVAPENQDAFHDGKVVCTDCRKQFHRSTMSHTPDGYLCRRCSDES